ncbi:radical SAM protein [Halobacteriovorax sp.]|uniref:B12-binding domain-containing radical SAM protein n=1 Tax=Halobacteriovorax sp. TaxID=2020862 RepID=UPI00356856D3
MINEPVNKLNVVLVRAPYVIPTSSVFGNQGTPALGLAYLAGTVERLGHNITCIDSFAKGIDTFTPIENTNLLINGIPNAETLSLIPEDTDILGISCMFSSDWINTIDLVKVIRQKYPKLIIILGGEHVTADHEYILTTYKEEVSLCILGEGEQKLANLLNTCSESLDNLYKAPGITYYNEVSGKVETNPSDYRVKNLETIPLPKWDGLELHIFHERLLGMSMIGKRTMPMLLSRGCPYQCTFCSSAKMWTTRWVARDYYEVIEEIKMYKDLYNINHIDFYDLTAIINKKWTIDFCKEMIRQEINLTWSLPSGTRSEALTHEVLDLLKKSGCTKITYAPETGSVRMSKLVKKKVNLKKMLSSMKNAVDVGLIVKANIIFGFPEERAMDRVYNFIFIFRMALVGIHDVPCFGFTPYPGSELFDELLEKGVIKRDENYYEFMSNLIYTKPFNNKSWNDEVSDYMIPCLSLGGMAFFYSLQYLFRPKRFYNLVVNVLKDSPQTMLEVAFANMYKDFVKGRRFQK